MTGFFNAIQRRKLAFVSWGALKKPMGTDELPLHQYSLKGFGKRARLGDDDEQEDAGERLMKVGNHENIGDVGTRRRGRASDESRQSYCA